MYNRRAISSFGKVSCAPSSMINYTVAWKRGNFPFSVFIIPMQIRNLAIPFRYFSIRLFTTTQASTGSLLKKRCGCDTCWSFCANVVSNQPSTLPSFPKQNIVMNSGIPLRTSQLANF